MKINETSKIPQLGTQEAIKKIVNSYVTQDLFRTFKEHALNNSISICLVSTGDPVKIRDVQDLDESNSSIIWSHLDDLEKKTYGISTEFVFRGKEAKINRNEILSSIEEYNERIKGISMEARRTLGESEISAKTVYIN